MDEILFGRTDAITVSGNKLREALERGAPHARISKEQMREILLILHTARDDRGLPCRVDYETAVGADGTDYLILDVILHVRPDDWPYDAPKAREVH